MGDGVEKSEKVCKNPRKPGQNNVLQVVKCDDILIAAHQPCVEGVTKPSRKGRLQPFNSKGSLAIFSRGALLLAQADTVQKAKELKDMAIVAGEWAKRKKMGEEAIQHCRSYALEAERKMGQMLASAPKNAGARGIGKSGVTLCNPTIAQLGIDKRESSEAQKLAELPQEAFERVKQGERSKRGALRDQRRAKVLQEVKLPKDKYRVLYADPPWKYNDACASGAIQDGGARTQPLHPVQASPSP